ncbi:MAG: VOC family protein [Clostridia bacterium]
MAVLYIQGSGDLYFPEFHDEVDMDAHYEVLKARGVQIVSPPRKRDNFPVYACFIRDPNNYKVEF